MDKKVSILLNLEEEKDKFLMVKQRFYPGKKSFNGSPSFKNLLIDIAIKLKKKEFENISHILFQDDKKNLNNDLSKNITHFTDVIIKPFLKNLIINNINIDFICKGYGFNFGKLSVPKGSIENNENKSYALEREFYEEIGISLQDLNLKVIEENNNYIGTVPYGTKIPDNLIYPNNVNTITLSKSQFINEITINPNIIFDFFNTIPNRFLLFRKFFQLEKQNNKDAFFIKNFLFNASVKDFKSLSSDLKKNKLSENDLIKEIKSKKIIADLNLDSYFEIYYKGFTHISDIEKYTCNFITDKLLKKYYSNKYKQNIIPIQKIVNVKKSKNFSKKKNNKKKKRK